MSAIKTFSVIYANAPVWGNAEHTVINLNVKFGHLPNEIKFAACATDCEAHGRDLFARAAAGEFGEMTEYQPPPPPSAEELSATARNQRDRLLSQTDWTQAADIPQATKDKWAPYRQALRDVPSQEGFPVDILWPQAP
jgi:hypothetical protein